jgi:hypothetical protein
MKKKLNLKIMIPKKKVEYMFIKMEEPIPFSFEECMKREKIMFDDMGYFTPPSLFEEIPILKIPRYKIVRYWIAPNIYKYRIIHIFRER